MDFIISLRRTKNDHDAIWVVVDRLTKIARFIRTRQTQCPGSRELVWFEGYSINNLSARPNSRPRYISRLSRPDSSVSPSVHAHMQCYRKLSSVANSAFFRNTARAPTLSL